MQPANTSCRHTPVSRNDRDQIVLEHLALVRAIAVRVHESLPVHVDLDDLIHAGVLGLFDAVDKYEPAKQVAFQAYAKHRIKGAILDSLRQLDWASRDMRKRHKKVEATIRELSCRLGRIPNEFEIAESLGVELERWHQIITELRNVGLLAGAAHTTEPENVAVSDFPGHPDFQPDTLCSRAQLRDALGRAMRALPERYRKIMLLYYTDELTMKQIGDMMGVNESRVSQIHKTALEKMAAVLHSQGIHSCHAFE